MLGLVLVDSMDHNVLSDDKDLEPTINEGKFMFTLSKVFPFFLVHTFSAFLFSHCLQPIFLVSIFPPTSFLILVDTDFNPHWLHAPCGFPWSPPPRVWLSSRSHPPPYAE